ncbi:CRISPR-associated helicase Cas3' [Sporanaerobacter acetigenes]|uniref:CRISPR-associated helicase Cas3' n=1 Tax=Sporanaerobacter acetigenes TaxID=165813 RepID=UPI00104F557E|nr:CRISPR-associated helicase Cas3' [Sporanaerobacter acetigenes]
MFESLFINNISKLVYKEQNIYAHEKEEIKKETLKEHSDLTLYYLERFSEEKQLEKIITNIIKELSDDEEILSDEIQSIIFEMFINAVYLHDIGKINPAFQKNKMNNLEVNIDKKHETHESKHSLLSSLIYIDIYIDEISKRVEDGQKQKFLYSILYSFSYVISRHHSFLEDLSQVEFIDKLERKLCNIKEDRFELTYYKYEERLADRKNFNRLRNRDRKNFKPVSFFILNKLLYSTIVNCDFYATHTYLNGYEPESKYIDNIDEILSIYENTKIYKGIQNYKKDKKYFGANSINTLRSEIFLESEENLIKSLQHGNIFYIEAPTGSGKTNTSINLAFNIVENNSSINKIFYIFPFNTLVEQTKSSFDEIFNQRIQDKFKVAVINSITPIITEEEKKEKEDIYQIDYSIDLLNRQTLNYPVVLTTHVNFFNYLFGTGREINLPFLQLCNSVVIIDEIQSYKNTIWPEIIRFLSEYSKLLNIKIIIMSATLPKLDKLISDDKANFIELIEDKDKYYQNKLFKERVKLNYELLDKEKISEEDIVDLVDKVYKERGEARVLIEFITKKTARKFYDKFIKLFDNKRKVVEITGDDSSYARNKIIGEINKKDSKGNFVCKDILVVATQVIEAGVDIDMDVGLKDISMLDGEEQFLGRINRSCKKDNCCAYFFNFDNANRVYGGDLRLELNLKDKDYQGYLLDKDFDKFYEKCFKRLDEMKKECNEKNMEAFFNDEVKCLNFTQIEGKMKLIDQENYQLFIAHEIEMEDGKVLDGKKVWKEYVQLLKDNSMDYAKKRIKLSKIAQQISYFTFNFLDYDDKYDRRPKYFNDNIGRIYYIEGGERFLTEGGKFDRIKYIKESGDIFL